MLAHVTYLRYTVPAAVVWFFAEQLICVVVYKVQDVTIRSQSKVFVQMTQQYIILNIHILLFQHGKPVSFSLRMRSISQNI